MFDWMNLPKAVVEFIKNTRVLFQHVKRHIQFYATVVIIALMITSLALVTNYLVLRPAQRTIYSYFDAIDNKNHQAAWSLLDTQYQSRWRGGVDSFRDGYSTTVAHDSVTLKGDPWLSALYEVFDGQALKFEVTFRATNRFAEQDLTKSIQKINLLWLNISNPTLFEALKTGKLGSEIASVELIRIFKQHVVVAKKEGHWRILSFRPISITLPEQ